MEKALKLYYLTVELLEYELGNKLFFNIYFSEERVPIFSHLFFPISR